MRFGKISKVLIFVALVTVSVYIPGAKAGLAATEIADDKVMALTFDDGPHPRYTPIILDILKENNSRATFFLIGERAKKLPELVSRIIEEGHSIGNHTYDHTELTRLSDADVLSQITKTNTVLEEITGVRPVLLRPPLGLHNKRIDGLIKSQRMCTVLWNIDPLDWYHKNAARTHKQVVTKAESGDIVLLHDFYQNTVMATEQIIKTLKGDGYRFVTIDELLGLSGGYAEYGKVYYSGGMVSE